MLEVPSPERPMSLADRADAGRQLATQLHAYRTAAMVVYAIPPGGVPVAVALALQLDVPLDVLAVSEVIHPRRPGESLGAVSEGGEAVGDARAWRHVDSFLLHNRIAEARNQALATHELLCAGQSRRPAEQVRAVLVDDGCSSATELEAAARTLAGEHPERLIVALPVASRLTIARLQPMAQRVLVLEECLRDEQAALHYRNLAPITEKDALQALAGLPPALRPYPRSDEEE